MYYLLITCKCNGYTILDLAHLKKCKFYLYCRLNQLPPFSGKFFNFFFFF